MVAYPCEQGRDNFSVLFIFQKGEHLAMPRFDPFLFFYYCDHENRRALNKSDFSDKTSKIAELNYIKHTLNTQHNPT